MIVALIGLVLPIGAAWLGLLASGLRSSADSRAMTGALAVCLGLAFAALGTFVTLTLGGHLSPVYAALDACLWVVVGALAWRRAGSSPVEAASLGDRRAALDPQDWLVRVVFVAVALMALSVPVVEYLKSPHGQWDAWAIWNQKARFMFRAGPEWTASMALTWSVPSHPMFVSLSVARLWAYAGAESTAVPAGLSLVYGAAVVALVVGALDERTRKAWVAGAVVMAPLTFSHLVAAQTADLPVALFLTASLVVLRDVARLERDDPRAPHMLALAGLLGGCAAFTKNEGFVFLAASTAVVAWVVRRQGRPATAVWWGAAALPLAALMIWFKLTFPVGTPEYFTENGGPGPLQRAMDANRMRAIGAMTLGFWWRWGGNMAAGALLATTVVSIAAAAAPGERFGRGLMWVVAVMVLSYYVVWVLSPMETIWLVGSTFDRLLAQVWPTLVIGAASVRLRS